MLDVADVPMPAPASDEVLVRVRACGICGSDVHGYDGSSGRRIPPLVMGHEAAGEIQELGSGVEAFARGDRVTFDSTVFCGSCEYCRRGAVNLCTGRRVLGVSCADYRRDGAFAEFVSVPARIVYRLPDDMSFEHAALIEAVSVAVHAVARKPPAPTDTVMVIGCGMIGLLVLQVLRQHGCVTTIGVDLDERRRSLALKMGAAHTLDPRTSDVPAEVQNLTGHRGADHVFEVVGHAETVKMAVHAARRGGSITLVGNLAPQAELPLQAVVTGELTLLGSCASSGEYPASIDLMARGAIDVSPLISAVVPLAEGPSWFERLHQRRGDLMKVILRP
jgi:L-iditol 2-dehydrogenase